MHRFKGARHCLSRCMTSSAKSIPEKSKAGTLVVISAVIGGTLAAAALTEQTHINRICDAVGMKFLHLLDPEIAHRVAVRAAGLGIVKDTSVDDPCLSTSVFGRKFLNPVGLAAGFDKNAEAVTGLMHMGFGFVEIGSVTPLPQSGNERPRVFRLREDRAVINRYGFNSDGAMLVKARLKGIVNDINDSSFNRVNQGVLGVNLGKNKVSEDAVADYIFGLQELGPYADYLVINISSPNTPGLRRLQGREHLLGLISRIIDERDRVLPTKNGCKTPLFIKIAPDLTATENEDIAQVALSAGVDGLIICNTTTERPSSLKSKHCRETGGLSGAPLREKATQAISEMYLLTQGRIPLIGVGGIATGRDAYEKILAGASLVQMYSSMVYDGPTCITHVKLELAECLRSDGYTCVEDAVGCKHRQK